MGYSTNFSGSLQIKGNLTKEKINYINTFSLTRHCKRDVNKLMELYKGEYGILDPKDNTPESIYGVEGEYYCCDRNINDSSIISTNCSINSQPKTMPGIWCQWEINENNELVWDGGEKFYFYTEWLEYLIENFFKRWELTLNGLIEWYGEEESDYGTIEVIDNVVTIHDGKLLLQ